MSWPTVTFGSLILAFLLAVVFGGPLIAALRRMKARQTISTDAPERHRTKQGTPTMGGLLILGAFAVSALVFGDRTVFPLVLITLAFGLIGFLDDYLIARRGKNLGLKARQKLVLQFAFAILAALWLHRIGHTGIINAFGIGGVREIALGFWYYPLFIVLMVWMSNATNLTDGLDGLAAGTMIASVAPFALMGGLLPVYIGSFAGAMIGACLGFLWFNAHPAKVFMGDTGSLAFGAGLVILAAMSGMELLLVFFCVIFIVEALSVMLQVTYFKLTHGKRILRMSPLHHHFELSGWEETRVVSRFWIIQAIFSTIGLWLVYHSFGG